MGKFKTRSKFDPEKEYRLRETRVWGIRVELFVKEIGPPKPALLSGGREKNPLRGPELIESLRSILTFFRYWYGKFLAFLSK